MITRYMTTLHATFNPLSRNRAHKIPRIILAFLSPDARLASGANIKVETKVLPQTSRETASLVVGFKDGRRMTFCAAPKEGEWDLRRLGVQDVVDEVDRHSRALRRKEELSGER